MGKTYVITDSNYITEKNKSISIKIDEKYENVFNPYFEVNDSLYDCFKQLLKSNNVHILYDGRSKDIHFEIGVLYVIKYLEGKFLGKLLLRLFGIKKKVVFLEYDSKKIKNKRYIKFLEDMGVYRLKNRV